MKTYQSSRSTTTQFTHWTDIDADNARRIIDMQLGASQLEKNWTKLHTDGVIYYVANRYNCAIRVTEQPDAAPTTEEGTRPMDSTIIYQCEAHNRSPYDAARLFASEYFEKPREIDWFRSGGDNMLFALVDGVATYSVTYREAVPFESPAVYVISRHDTPNAPTPAALPADNEDNDEYVPTTKLCAQCGEEMPYSDAINCASCEEDNAAIEALAPEWDDLSSWEKYADPFELRLTETTYAGHPLLTWDHIKVWKGRKVGKVPHAIGLSKARAIVDYHADVYLFATTAGDDEVLPHNKTNSKRNDVPHIDTFKGNKVLHLPCKGKPFSFGLKMAVIYAQYYDQIREFCQRHWRTDPEAAAQAEPTISAAEVGAIVETWLIDSIKRMTPMLPAGNVTNLVENENCGECGQPAARTRADGSVFGGSLYNGRLLCPDCHEPFESGLSKRSKEAAALDASFTGKAAQLNMFESVQLNLFPAVPASTDALPMTSTTDLRGAAPSAPTIQPAEDEDGEPLPMTCTLLAPGEYAYTIRGHFTGLTRRSANQWEVSNPPAGFNKVYESKQAFEQAIQPYLAAPPDPRPSADELSRRASLPEYDEAQRRRDISLCADCGEFTSVDPDETGDLHCGCTEPETETPTTIEAEEQPMDINAYRRELISKAQQRLAAGKPLQYRTYYKVGPIHEVKADSDSRLRYKSGSKWYADAGDQILDQIARQLGMTTAWDYAHPDTDESPAAESAAPLMLPAEIEDRPGMMPRATVDYWSRQPALTVIKGETIIRPLRIAKWLHIHPSLRYGNPHHLKGEGVIMLPGAPHPEVAAYLAARQVAAEEAHTTVHLQAIGKVSATQAQHLKRGDVIMFNYGYKGTVLEVSVEGKTTYVTYLDHQQNKVVPYWKKRSTTLVATPNRTDSPAPEVPAPLDLDANPAPDPAKVEAYEERRQRRVDALRTRAAKRRSEGASRQQWADHIGYNLNGQPILIGHHSEKRHRRLIDKMHNNMRKAIRLYDEAESLDRRAKAAESNRAISSDDPQAAQKIAARIKQLEAMQDSMKAANKIVKGKGTNEEKIERLIDLLKCSETRAAKLLLPDWCGRVGFPNYELTNNSANIRRLKDRLETLRKQAEAEYKEQEIEGLRIVEDPDENRVQLFFDGKPDAETIKELKMRGFRWSPSAKAWQRHLNGTAQYAAECIAKHWQERQQ
jgi:hypothetical protein